MNAHRLQTTPHRILLADAEHTARSALEELLREEGYRVTPASNGAEARAALEAHVADLLLMDLSLALADGEALLEIVRARYPEVSTILMTGFPPYEPRVAHVLQNPNVEIIRKPVDLQTLFDAVDLASSRTRLVTGVVPRQTGKWIPASLGEFTEVR